MAWVELSDHSPGVLALNILRTATNKMLEIRGLSKNFGGLVAVDKVSLSVAEGEVVGLIGPNGSGKTTLINCISGFYLPDAGEVRA